MADLCDTSTCVFTSTQRSGPQTDLGNIQKALDIFSETS